MADQVMYHQGNQSVFVGGRLWTLLPPLHESEIMNNNKTAQKPKRSFTSVQMVHTHTHCGPTNFSFGQVTAMLQLPDVYILLSLTKYIHI